MEVGRFTLVAHNPRGTATSADIASPLAARLGPSIRLLGYTLPRATVAPNGAIELTLYWQTAEALTARYKVFTQLIGQDYNAATGNFIWGQKDNEPDQGMTPTTTWTPGVIMVDRYSIPVDPDAPPGVYTLQVGLYGLVDGARLPVFGSTDQPQGDAVMLGQIEVRPGP